MTELILNKPGETFIPAIDPRHATGFLLKKGARYKFEVAPAGQTWNDGSFLKPFSPDGRIVPYLIPLQPLLRMPMVKWFALLGSINNKKTGCFKIGSLLPSYTAPEEGELFCFANDAPGFNDFFYTHNNSGTLRLEVTRIE